MRGRKHRLTPRREQRTKAWRFTDSDRKVLECLARYRYLRSSSVGLLTGLPERTRNYSLRKLFDRRLLDKPKSQAIGYNSLNDPDIYEITQKGSEYLTRHYPETTNLIRHRGDMPVKQFRHAMMICDTLSAIEAGATQAGYRFISAGEIIERSPVERPMKLSAWLRGKQVSFIPDGMFGLAKDDNYQLFFLEAEHYNPLKPKKLNRASFYKKILLYGSLSETDTLKRFGKKRFRTLFVFPNKTRSENAQAIVAEEYKQSAMFLMTHVPIQEERFEAPEPFPELFTVPWLRGGLEPKTLV
ncbi:hypothetical protein ACMA5I_10390 [Paracoccaceae bacterium GXU_MW_L88]